MAFGDPMVMETIYNGDQATQSNFDSLLENGPLEIWSNTGAAPDGWTESILKAVTSHGRAAGTRTSGVGSYYMTYLWPTGTTNGTALIFNQYVPLKGHERFVSRGHKGRTFKLTFWVRVTTTGNTSWQIILYGANAAGTPIESLGTVVDSTPSGSWTEITVTGSIANDATVQLLSYFSFTIDTTLGIGVTATLDLDEFALYEYYTFAVNAAMPDDPKLSVPNRSFRRTVSNKLIRHRPGSVVAAKYEYTLHFGLIGLTQVEALRSLYLLDTPIRWQPNLPHLPTYVQVVIVDAVDFRLRSPSVNSNNYFGTLNLVEI